MARRHTCPLNERAPKQRRNSARRAIDDRVALVRAEGLLLRIADAYGCPIETFDSGALVRTLRDIRAWLADRGLPALLPDTTTTERTA